MELAVMEPTNRNKKLVTYSAPKCTWLRKPEVMRVRRQAATDKASLPHNEFAVIFVAQAHRFAQRTNRDFARPFSRCHGSSLTGVRTPISAGVSLTFGRAVLIGHHIGR
jgi:hypothetical protein